MADFSKNIKILRRESDWTQKQMAERLNVTEKTVWRWENGLAEPSIKDIKTIYKFFGESIEWLLGLRAGR